MISCCYSTERYEGREGGRGKRASPDAWFKIRKMVVGGGSPLRVGDLATLDGLHSCCQLSWHLPGKSVQTRKTMLELCHPTVN